MQVLSEDVKGKRWLTVEQAAAYLGCSRNFLDKDRMSQLHGIPFARLGRHIRYDRFQLDAFLEEHSCLDTFKATGRA